MSVSVGDRVISVLTYYTFGIFGLIWLVFANLTRKRISPFLSFNIYQSIFISVVLAVISLLYGIAINFLSIVPYLGKLAVAFDIFFNRTPLYFSFTLSGLFIAILLVYLSILSLGGKRPYIPFVSDVINVNFGG